MKRTGLLVLAVLAGCAATEDASRQSDTGGCLFWSTECTRLEDPAATPALPPSASAELATPSPSAAELPETTELPREDLGRVRARHSPRTTDRETEADFNARFAGEPLAPPAETTYPLPADCSAPPSTLLRNSPGGRFAPQRNSAAATAYASAYDRCRQPGTWPRPQ